MPITVFAADHDFSLGQLLQQFAKLSDKELAHKDNQKILTRLKSYLKSILPSPEPTTADTDSPACSSSSSAAAAGVSADIVATRSSEIYLCIASIRQDLKRDLLNLMQYYEFNPHVYHNGSIFAYNERVLKILSALIGQQVNLSPLLTADFFPELWHPAKTSASFEAGAYLQHPAHKARAAAYLAAFSAENTDKFQPIDEMPGLKPDVDLPALIDDIPIHSFCDLSKFLTVWTQCQHFANLYPDEMINYHFFDDNSKYGENLLSLFAKHPELLPSNVTFIAHQLIVEGVFISLYMPKMTTQLGTMQGKGAIHSDYVSKARNFAQSAPAKSPGTKIFDGVITLTRLSDSQTRLANLLTTKEPKKDSTAAMLVDMAAAAGRAPALHLTAHVKRTRAEREAEKSKSMIAGATGAGGDIDKAEVGSDQGTRKKPHIETESLSARLG